MSTLTKRSILDSKMCIIIIAMNLLVFIAQKMYPQVVELLQLHPDPATLMARSWTLVTVFFLHIHEAHLLGTMLIVFYAGSRLEEAVGPRHLFYIYVVTGITGSAAVLAASRFIAMPEPYVGASAAALGILGASVVVPLKDEIRSKDLKKVLIVVIITNIAVLFFDLQGMAASTLAHFAGMAAGVVYGNMHKLYHSENLKEMYERKAKGRPKKTR